VNLVEGQLDESAIEKSVEQAHGLLAIISMHEMESFARQ